MNPAVRSSTIPTPSIDVERLASYCRGRIPDAGGGFLIHQITGGSSNPTYALTSRESGKQYVLRKKPSGTLLPTAHQVEREYRVMAALGDASFPVPAMRLLCEDDTIIGTAFYIMDFVDGRIFRKASLPDSAAEERRAIYDELNAVLARLHSIDHRQIGLADFGRAGNYYERQMARWVRQYRAAEPDPEPAMEALISALSARIPADAATSITHGDFRLENMIFHPVEPRIVAVLDWELSTTGHPLADLAYNCLMYHSTSEIFGSLKGVDLESAGLPSEAEYVEAYCRRTGRTDLPDWGFYLAFAQFRLLAIGAGVVKRARDGLSDASRITATDPADDPGRRAEYALALMAG